MKGICVGLMNERKSYDGVWFIHDDHDEMKYRWLASRASITYRIANKPPRLHLKGQYDTHL